MFSDKRVVLAGKGMEVRAETDGRSDFREIYFENKTAFFSLWILLIVIDFVDACLKDYYGLSGFGVGQILAYSCVVGSIVSARSSSHWLHAAWGILCFVIMSWFEYANFSVLRAR